MQHSSLHIVSNIYLGLFGKSPSENLEVLKL